MSTLTKGQKYFLIGTAVVFGLLIFLPLTFGIYTVSERAGGLIPALAYGTGIFGSSYFFLMALSNWVGEKNGRKLSFFESLMEAVWLGFLQVVGILALVVSMIVLSYGWKLIGVAPFS